MPGPYSAAITFSLYTIPQRVVQHFRFGMADALDLLEIGDGAALTAVTVLKCASSAALVFSPTPGMAVRVAA